MKTLYFDVVSGASGDMILASLVDLGVPAEHLQTMMDRLELPGLKIGAERTKRSGIECCHMALSWDEPGEYRHLHQIMEIIGRGRFGQRVVGRCEKVLTRLAEAEARVHGTAVDRVHFHEIGAVDTIVDVLGAALCLEYLGVDAVAFSPLTDGRGTVKVAHGLMPVPVPAVARMIEGFHVRTIDVSTELLTPTGCAILTALGEQRECMPEGRLTAQGYGCGDKRLDHYPNVLRSMLIEEACQAAGGDTVWVLESDMDHVSGEVMGHCAELCMAQGALDVTWTPVFMKKGRPGYRMTVLCTAADREKLTDAVMVNTRTLGVRCHTASRTIAERSTVQVRFGGAEATEKRCSHKGHAFSKLEYESLAALSRSRGVPLVDLMDAYLRTGPDK